MQLSYRGIPYTSAANVQHRYPYQVQMSERKSVTMIYRGIAYTR
ncbi:DUF4278 domain-containing protein [Haemophilus parainfluenzae]|nr:DUF4278 domain-containing protein [Haemophilus parainfluenzae]